MEENRNLNGITGDIEDASLWDDALIDALKRAYSRILAVNLTRDTYFVIKDNWDSRGSGRERGRYSALHLQGLASTHPDYQEIFAAKFSRENLLARYASGEYEEYLEARQMGPDRNFHWATTHAIRVTNRHNDDVLQIILIYPVDEQRELENEVDRVRAEANRYRGAIMRTFDHIYEVDIANDSVCEIKFSNGNVRRDELGNIDMMHRALILERMHPSNLESYGGNYPWLDLLHGDKNCENPKDMYEDDWYMRQSNGQYRWERIQIIPSEDDPGEIMVFSKDIHDVKLREEMQRELLFEALASAENANAAKRDFLSRMSHDMRTPMNAIVGLTTIAQAKLGDNEKIADALNKIRSSSQHLLHLINEVLDMSRIESGKIALEEEEFNISELLESVMASIRTQTREKQQMLVVNTHDLSNGWMLGDRFHLEQVLLNLLSNAVKYTGKGGFVMLSLCDLPGPQDHVSNLMICVEDNGVGMSDEFMQHMFEPFEREGRNETMSEQGTGLGLSIVKSIVDRMHGTIRVDSAVGMGTCFVVTIPVKLINSTANEPCVDPCAQQADEEEFCEGKYEKYRFLLVDDNELNREIGQEILQMFGAKVDLACDGQEAIDILIQSPEGWYDAVFMDVQMPVKDGYSATRELRALVRDDLRDLPIFAMTANAFADDVQDALDAGMNAHIAKPLDLTKLNRVLDQFLN